MLATYLFATAVAFGPLEAHDYTGAPRAQTELRYHAIAADLAGVVLDPAEAPLFEGPTGRAQTAVLVLAIASYESGGFRADVDRQDQPTGDGGHAWCLGQVHDPYARGLTDRPSCFRAMLAALRDSWAMCRPSEPAAWDPAYRISGYTVGSCQVGERHAVKRAGRATRWWAFAPWLAPVDGPE
jgi:hypothetical protein